MTHGLRRLAAALALILLVAAHAYAQPDDTPIDVSGEWVGVIEWDYSARSGGASGDVLVYRLNIAQDGMTLHARHLTDPDDVLYTQPVEAYTRPDGGFEGSISDDLITFPNLSIITGHCTISIVLHYAEISGEQVLVGEWSRDPIIIPTPQITPVPDERAPDVVVGCGSPSNGDMVLRRFVAQRD
jgi:hypothetical protein